MRPGTIVEVIADHSRGIVISQNMDYLNVLFEDYKVIPINKEKVSKTGRYFDLSIIWEMVKGKR